MIVLKGYLMVYNKLVEMRQESVLSCAKIEIIDDLTCKYHGTCSWEVHKISVLWYFLAEEGTFCIELCLYIR